MGNKKRLGTWSESLFQGAGTQEQELDFVFQFLGYENDLIVIDRHGIVLRVSDQYEPHYGLPSNSIVGRSIYDLEREGVFKPSVTATALREQRKVTIMQLNLLGEHILATGIPIFGPDQTIKYVAGFNSVNTAGILTPTERLEKLREIVGNYNTELRVKHLRNMEKEHLVFNSSSMLRINETILQIADTNASALLTGETGVGKSMIARIIHKCSLRASGPMVEINCGAIPEALIEAELFGYVGGAFTGADAKGRIGKIQAAQGGTLFLDEIGEMPLNMQLRLLQVLQERKIVRIGSTQAVDVDFRLITATNRDLQRDVEQGRFRQDLYYRIHVVPIAIPALRERREDIVPLSIYFLKKYNAEYTKQVELSQQSFQRLEQYPWPGNIRELENEIERTVIMSKNGVADPAPFSQWVDLDSSPESSPMPNQEGRSYQSLMEEYEQSLFLQAYRTYGTSVAVGRALKIGQTTAARKLRKYLKKPIE